MIYTTKDILTTQTGQKYYQNKIYPEIPLSKDDLYIITTIGDRLDTLAQMFYKNVKYWKVISFVNDNITNGSLYPQPGTQLRIPANVNDVIVAFQAYNQANI
jgi:hypothetical protein